ncbi:MAG: hypothetical protein K8R90_02330 [Candidatus Cloacimonetes bacterium]|nr:hypothetical protein [Candidatus Cloacimonadota bacterium]
MKKAIVLVIAILLLASLAARKTAPPRDALQSFGQLFVNAMQQQGFDAINSLLLDNESADYIVAETMNSDEMLDSSDDDREFTRQLLELTFDSALDGWIEQFDDDVDSVRAYATEVYGIDWGKVEYIGGGGEVQEGRGLTYVCPLQIHFRHTSGEYTLWVQEAILFDDEWRISGFNMEITSRGAPKPVFDDPADDDADEDIDEDNWAEDMDDDTWETDPANDPRSRKEIEQQDMDSWDQEPDEDPDEDSWEE